MHRGIKLICAIACVLVSVSAWGQEPPTESDRDRAALEFRKAQDDFSKGNYSASALAFEAAASLLPHASVWLNAAEAWELAGNPLRASENCDRALATEGISQEEAAEASKRQTRFATKLGRLEVSGDASMRVALDAEAKSALPLMRWVSPGSHRLLIVDGDSTREMQLDLQAGVHRKIELAKTSAPAEKRPAAEKRPTPPVVKPPVTEAVSPSLAPPVATWVSYGAAGASAVVMATFGALTLKAADDFDAQPTRENADVFVRNRLVTNVALGIAAGAAAVGTIIWVVDASLGSATTVAIQPSANGSSFVLRGTF